MNPNDAIDDQALPDNDVSADEQYVADADAKPQLSERELRMRELARDYREHHGYATAEDAASRSTEEDDDDGDEPLEDIKTPPQKAAVDDDTDDGAAPDPLKELGYYRKDDGKLYTRMKVNGVEKEVAADQVAAYLQKDIAGDQKLQQAADRERQLQQREREIQAMEAKIRQQSSQPPEKGAEEIRQQAKSVLSSLWDGDDDAAADALMSFIRQNSSQVDTNELLQQAEQRTMTVLQRRDAEQQQREWDKSTKEGIEWLRENHVDMLEDEGKRDYVDHLTARMVDAKRNGDPTLASLTPRDIIERAAKEANKLWQAATPPEPESNAREERKKNLKPLPRGLAKQQNRKPPKEVDTSPAAVIERMRAARAVN